MVLVLLIPIIDPIETCSEYVPAATLKVTAPEIPPDIAVTAEAKSTKLVAEAA